MSKAIVYSLFGYERTFGTDGFNFNSYLRGLLINVRMNRILYPGWVTILQTDKATYNAYKDLLDALPIKLEVHQDNVPLTLAMLWRLRPAFDNQYTHILCRDLDSNATYREVQAVNYWISKDKSAHAITDSVSHDVPMLGGMIGFRPEYFKDKVNANSWAELINKRSYDWNVKGSDQSFLRDVVYPCFAQHGNDAITQHYIKGMPNSFLSDYHTTIEDIDIGLPIELKESNDTCGHIGAAGYYSTAMSKFLNKHPDKEIEQIELNYPDLFSWVKNGCY